MTDLAAHETFAWWRAALAGQRPPITSEPQCGFFRRRLVKGGPWVPVCIWWGEPPRDADGSELADAPLRCVVDGKPADPLETWLWVAMNPISSVEYRAQVETARTRQAHGDNARTPRSRLTAPIPRF